MYLKANHKNIWVHPAIEVFVEPGKGAALRTTRSLGPNVKLLEVRPGALLNAKTVGVPSGDETWTSHQRLAHFLAQTIHASQPPDSTTDAVLCGSIKLSDQTRVRLPTLESLETKFRDRELLWRYLQTLPRNYDNMPLCWEEEQVPVELRDRVAEQRQQLRKDYKVTCGLEGVPEEDTPGEIPFRLFEWAWLTVNTRCLYIGLFGSASQNLTLAPVIDLLNHTAGHGCVMRWDGLRGMSIHTDRRAGYEAGEEVHITYGHHPNAFLAVEYGFVLAGNGHESVDLGPALPLLCEGYEWVEQQRRDRDERKDENEREGQRSHRGEGGIKDQSNNGQSKDQTNTPSKSLKRPRSESESLQISTFLSEMGYLGDYTVSCAEPPLSFRTTVAAIALAHPDRLRTAAEVAAGRVDESRYAVEVARVVRTAVEVRVHQIGWELERVDGLAEGYAKELDKALYAGWLHVLEEVSRLME